MRLEVLAATLAVSLAACGPTSNVYPDAARADFDAACPLADSLCACTWEEITQHVPYDEFKEALERFKVKGLMDPRIAQARATCLEKTPH